MDLADTPAAGLREPPAAGLTPGNVVQIDPVGRRMLSPRPSPLDQRMGMRAVTPPAFMGFDRFCRLVDAMVPPAELHLGGEDEPLLHPRFFDMVSYATGKGFDVSAATRLPGLTADRAEECVDSGLRRLYVVIDGKPSALQERSLRRLEEARRRIGSRFPEVILGGEVRRPDAMTRFDFSGQPLGEHRRSGELPRGRE